MAGHWQLPSALHHLPEALQFLRELQGLSKSELSQASGLTRAQLYSYESGRHAPNVRNLGVILDALDSSFLDLFYAQLRVYGFSVEEASILGLLMLKRQARRDVLSPQISPPDLGEPSC